MSNENPEKNILLKKPVAFPKSQEYRWRVAVPGDLLRHKQSTLAYQVFH